MQHFNVPNKMLTGVNWIFALSTFDQSLEHLSTFRVQNFLEITHFIFSCLLKSYPPWFLIPSSMILNFLSQDFANSALDFKLLNLFPCGEVILSEKSGSNWSLIVLQDGPCHEREGFIHLLEFQGPTGR